MSKYILILIFTFSSFIAFSQDEAVTYYEDEFPSYNYYGKVESKALKPQKASLFSEDNFKFRFTTGSSYTNLWGNNIFSTYVMPEVKYKFNDKFSISGGMIASLNYSPNFTYPGSENNIPMNNKMYSYYIFAKGEYQVNDRLRVRAATFFNVGNNYNSGQFSVNNIGFDVKITEKAYFSADFIVHKSNGLYPSFYSPFGGYFDSFHSSPIGGTSMAFDRSGW